jgi:hypothetical protein
MKTRAILTFCFLSFVSSFCFGQSPSCSKTFFVATFVGEKNDPLVVSAHDIRVRIGDGLVAPESLNVAPLSAPPRIVIVLDMSGSMRERWEASILSAIGMVKASSPSAPIGLVAFNEKLATVPISRQHSEIEHELRVAQAIHPKGRSSVIDAVELALRMLTPPQPGDALFIVSDGADNHSHLKYRILEQEVLRSRARLFLVAPTSENASDPEEIMGPADLIALAEESGGEIFRLDVNFASKEPTRSQQVTEILGILNNRIYQKLLRPELIEVTMIPTSERLLSLRVESLEPGKSMRITAPKKVPACSVSPVNESVK